MAKRWSKLVTMFLIVLVLVLAGTGGIGHAATKEHAEIYDFRDVSLWDGLLPRDFGFYNYKSNASYVEQGLLISQTDEGFGLLKKQVTLEANSIYKVTVHGLVEEIGDAAVGANIGFDDQLASKEGIYNTGTFIENTLYVRTNADDAQTYVLTVGLGKETNLITGDFYIQSLMVEQVDSVPEGEVIEQLVGSLSEHSTVQTGFYSSQPVTRKNRVEHDRDEISYDHVGEALFALVLTIALYLVFTGKWAAKLGRFFSGDVAIFLLFVAGFVLRNYLAYTDLGFTAEMDGLKRAAMGAYEGGLGNFYTGSKVGATMPLYAVLSWVVGLFRSLMGLSIDSQMFALFVRMPGIVADVLIAYIIYKIAKNYLSKHTAALVAAVVLFLPALFMHSGIYGANDSVYILLALLSLYCLQQGKSLWSGIAYGLGVLANAKLFYLLPIFLMAWVGDFIGKEDRKRLFLRFLNWVVGAVLIYMIVILPVKGSGAITFALPFGNNLMGDMMGYGANNGFNLITLLGGNGISAASTFLLGRYDTFSMVLTIVWTVAIIACYLKDANKDALFFYGALLFAGICAFGIGMDGRLLLTVVIMLLVAAVQTDSRQLLLNAFLYAGMSFLNRYVVYAFGGKHIYTQIVSVLSCIHIVIFVFFAFDAAVLIFKKRLGHAIKVPELPGYTFGERGLAAAGERLGDKKTYNKLKMVRKDYLWVIGITVIYAIVAFTNLGSTAIPGDGTVVDMNEVSQSEIVLELEEPQFVGNLKYYTGYCEGKFTAYYSLDGVTYTQAEIVEHWYRFMFRWEFIGINSEVKYIKLVPISGTLEFREIGAFSADNKILPIAKASLTVDGVAQDAAFLIDEQDQVPETTSYMTEMYFDEIYHARTAYEYIHGIYPYEITHPPLGKSIIALGIQIFGMNPFGWRFMGTLFGVLMLPLLYVFAKKLFGRTMYAVAATVLFAADFMHFTLTRIATIDSFSIFFILAMYFFMYCYMERSFNKEPLNKTLVPLGLSGISFALGAATKWICIYAGGGLAVLFFYTLYKRHQEYRYGLQHEMAEVTAEYKKKLTRTLLFCVAVFIVIPITVYCLSYIPYQKTAADGFGLKGIWENQQFMLGYHGKLGTEKLHSYQSNAYTWPFTIRPVFFFRADDPPTGSAGVTWNMGNPLVWIGGLIFVLYLIGLRDREGKHPGVWKGLQMVGVAALFGFVPWLLVNREIFIYHYFAVVPFLILATVYALRYIVERYKWGKKLLIGYLSFAVILFFLFYPANTGIVVSRTWLNLIQWLPTWPI